MTPADVQLVRLSFGDMANALARGDVDAYVGSEPGPSINVLVRKRARSCSIRTTRRSAQINVVFCDAPGLGRQRARLRARGREDARCGLPLGLEAVESRRVRSDDHQDPRADQRDARHGDEEHQLRLHDRRRVYRPSAKYYGAQMVALKEISPPDYSTFINTAFLPK
jgi:NitT/TauT family transport system substrate-binding protein